MPKHLKARIRELLPAVFEALAKDLADPDPEVRRDARNVVLAYNFGPPEGFEDEDHDILEGTAKVVGNAEPDDKRLADTLNTLATVGVVALPRGKTDASEGTSA